MNKINLINFGTTGWNYKSPMSSLISYVSETLVKGENLEDVKLQNYLYMNSKWIVSSNFANKLLVENFPEEMKKQNNCSS